MSKNILQLIYRPIDFFVERKRTTYLYSEAQTALTTATMQFATKTYRSSS